jgi:hypothetical protein
MAGTTIDWGRRAVEAQGQSQEAIDRLNDLRQQPNPGAVDYFQGEMGPPTQHQAQVIEAEDALVHAGMQESHARGAFISNLMMAGIEYRYFKIISCSALVTLALLSAIWIAGVVKYKGAEDATDLLKAKILIGVGSGLSAIVLALYCYRAIPTARHLYRERGVLAAAPSTFDQGIAMQ